MSEISIIKCYHYHCYYQLLPNVMADPHTRAANIVTATQSVTIKGHGY